MDYYCAHGNDAAVTIAEHIAGSVENFAIIMNNKAKELNLKSTNFVTPHGLDSNEHYTTAYELALITDYALKNSKFSEIVSTQNCNVKINNNIKNIHNTNELLGYLEGVNGVKTGFTNNAGRCLVTSVKRNNLNVICVVLGANTRKIRTADSIKLIEYVYKNFKQINIKELIQQEFNKWKDMKENTIIINKGTVKNPILEIQELEYENLPVLENKMQNISFNFNNIENLEAPVNKNCKLGSLKVLIEDKEIIELDILNKEQINKKQILDYFIELLCDFKIKTIQEI